MFPLFWHTEPVSNRFFERFRGRSATQDKKKEVSKSSSTEESETHKSGRFRSPPEKSKRSTLLDHDSHEDKQSIAALQKTNAALKQEIVKLKEQHWQIIQDRMQQLDQMQASHQRTTLQLSQQLEQCNRQLLQANRANTDLQQQLQDTSQQLLQANHEVEQLQQAQQEASAHDIEPWKVARAKVELGDEIARGGWGSVSEGKVRVAVKQLHMAIASERNIQRLKREIKILSQIRHPNLVQFIGAVFDEQAERLLAPPLIITELLDTNLRSAYEQNRLSGGQKLSISKDVAKALKYLHERHDPIIHRDVSAPNVLLEALPDGNWRGKLTDLGSANFARVAQTLAEGAIVYSAPETFPRVYNPDAPPPPQTFKIDVFSFGVMLCEVTTSRFPDQNEYGDMLHQVRNTCPPMFSLIEVCTKEKQEQRPKMTDILRQLDNIGRVP